jgi:hypothetical protein
MGPPARDRGMVALKSVCFQVFTSEGCGHNGLDSCFQLYFCNLYNWSISRVFVFNRKNDRFTPVITVQPGVFTLHAIYALMCHRKEREGEDFQCMYEQG